MARAIVNAQYCAQGEVTLKAQERVMSIGGDGFQIKDDQGRLWFRVDNKLFSMREKRALVDATGRTVCGLQKKLISLKPTFQITRGDSADEVIAEIKPKLLSLKPCVNVFLVAGDGDREPDFKCQGNFRAKKFEVVSLLGGQETEYAKIKKESQFSSGAAFFKARLMPEADAYFIHAPPGADLAFLCALCIAVDELFQEPKGPRD
ncbi:LURP-one-related 10-like [Micractinium conductrix]|uniref:LURP-one-related 10-like n=1 Tax=Micractinium conductrix TaxID=554055 RepID=A0A2P6V0Q5_9CHLO|nr:LURP-one-related 10-like [Micractinium conductrix]|eukprot:PSC67671.1 LURP-one-related 10-like [Micractinium conductrix]